MKRDEWLRLHEPYLETNPKTGRQRRRYRFVGKVYALPADMRAAALRQAGPAALAVLAAFLTAGLTNSQGSHCLYVLPQFMICFLPLYYLLAAVLRLLRRQTTVTELDVADALNPGVGGALALAILGALWVIGQTVFLLIGSVQGAIGLDLLFLGCGGITCAGGWIAWRALKKLTWTEVEKKA